MAVLSFKKRSKEDGADSVSSGMGDLSLGGGDISLGSLGGGIGTLSDLDAGSGTAGSLDDSFMSRTPKMDDRKLQEFEANVNDLKTHVESSDLATRAMKSEMEFMKNDLSQINDSIRTLLNVYEAVSRQYNPFVENDAPESGPALGALKADAGGFVDDVQTSKFSGSFRPNIGQIASEAPFDEDGPLDRIVKPDVEEPIVLEKEEFKMTSIIEPTIERVQAPVRTVASPASGSIPYEDVYALEQARRLIDHMMGKICRERSVGKGIEAADVKALDLWMGEFKRLGGL
ncbi:MAG: hypothetical protein ISF22_09195 [Methanomassiliicoccus sp.]|nr:hypothetical protein [Methanomassiliicoccus sp.]